MILLSTKFELFLLQVACLVIICVIRVKSKGDKQFVSEHFMQLTSCKEVETLLNN